MRHLNRAPLRILRKGNGHAFVTIGNTITNGISNVSGTVISAGYNLSYDNGGGFLNQISDQVGTDPMLDPAGPQDNGGPTLTIRLLPESPAIDTGKNQATDATGNVVTTDQRGFSRTVTPQSAGTANAGDGTDIGPSKSMYVFSATAGDKQTATVGQAFGIRLQATLTESGKAVSGMRVMFQGPNTRKIIFDPDGDIEAAVFTGSDGVATAPVMRANSAGIVDVMATAYPRSANFVETITPADQTLTVTTHAPASGPYNSSFTVAASSNSNRSLTVSYRSAGACTNNGPTFKMTSGTGVCTVTYEQPGNVNFKPVQVIETVNAQKIDQLIAVSTHAPANADQNASFTVAATSSSGLPITFGSAGSCTNTGPLFSMTSGTGICTVKYEQAGTATTIPRNFPSR